MVEIGSERTPVNEIEARQEETDDSLPAAVTAGSSAIAANAAVASNADLDGANLKLTQELDAAKSEVSGLKVTNEKVSLRLDGAINQMKLMLEDS